MRNDYDRISANLGSPAPYVEVLDITHSEFLYFAGVVKDEDASSWEASNAIAGAVLNQLAWKQQTNPKVTLTQRLDKTSTVGSKKSISAGATDSRSMNAKRGTLQALMGLDLSNGAVYWDGFDFAGKGVNHTKSVNMGLLIHTEHFTPFVNIWSSGNLLSNYSGGTYSSVHQSLITTENVLRWVATGRNKGAVLYESSAQVGRTIFWKLSSESQ